MAKIFNRFISSALVRTILYALALALAFAALFFFFPDIQSAIYSDAGGDASGGTFRDALSGRDYLRSDSRRIQAAVAFALLVASLLFVAPIAWMYMVTKRQEGFDQTFVQVLFLLPVVVAAVVRVVRGDLALAFALAGIVAAVRFRTTLKDLKNAVFAFAAIAIGLASGTGAFMLAGVLAFVFSTLSYILWRFSIGSLVVSHVEQAGSLRLAEVLVPGESRKSVVVGDESLNAEIELDDVSGLQDHIKRLAKFVRGDAMFGKKQYKLLLLVFVKGDVEKGKTIVQKAIDSYSKRWHLVDSFPGKDDATVLEYLVRPKKNVEIGKLLGELKLDEEDSPIMAAQLKSIKGLQEMVG